MQSQTPLESVLVWGMQPTPTTPGPSVPLALLAALENWTLFST